MTVDGAQFRYLSATIRNSSAPNTHQDGVMQRSTPARCDPTARGGEQHCRRRQCHAPLPPCVAAWACLTPTPLRANVEPIPHPQRATRLCAPQGAGAAQDTDDGAGNTVLNPTHLEEGYIYGAGAAGMFFTGSRGFMPPSR